MIKLLKWLSILCSIGMIFVLLGGALVTKTESGDGCGSSWPLCHGQLLPSEIDFELVVELSHRLVSGSVGIFVLALVFIAWKYIGHIREVKFLSVMSLFFLILQGLIGAAAVVWGQSDFVLAMHFGISLVSFATIFLLTLLIFEVDKKFDASSVFIEKKHRIEIYLLTIYTLIAVYSGALVRHTQAELACSNWPFCSNSEPFTSLFSQPLEIGIQMGHRLIAGILFVWTILFAIKMIKHYQGNRVMYWSSLSLALLIGLQVIFGALIIFTQLNLGVALMHALFISCYFAVLTYIILLASRSTAKEKRKTDRVRVVK